MNTPQGQPPQAGGQLSYRKPQRSKKAPQRMMVVAAALLLAACGTPAQPGSNSTSSPAAVASASPSTVAAASPAPSLEAASNQSASPVASVSPQAEPSDETQSSASPAKSGSGSNDGVDKGGAVDSLEDVKTATIYIEATGSFFDPATTQYLNSVTGSGFIIDSSGLAVTNNHVVTGSSLRNIYIGGEGDALPAKIVAVSECSDLALIDIDGEGFPYLTWASGEIKQTSDVIAAGFPEGNPNYNTTKGTISKFEPVDTPWAAVRNAVFHEAKIRGGNSGGPLVNTDGEVVGVNYAGSEELDYNLAIARDEAVKVIEELKQGNDVRSLGINGEAVQLEDGTSGVWVRSVEPGSPADKALIKGGDIITQLQNTPLATDGTMSTYCQILGGLSADSTIDVELLRFSSGEVLKGQINGRELEVVTSFEQIGSEDTAQSSGPESYEEYQLVSDDSGAIEVELPVEWSEIDGSAWTVDGQRLGVKIQAAPSIDAWNESMGEPGVYFAVSRSLAQNTNEDELLSFFDLTEYCTKTESKAEYDDGLYTGVYDYYEECEGGNTAVVLTFVPENRAYVGLVFVRAISPADFEALDRIVETFRITGTISE